jgi:predicted SAM-dependent methyltransferase
MNNLSKYLDPLRVAAGVGRRASAYSAKTEKRKRHTKAKAWIDRAKVPFKVNVGCGKEPFPGWANLDLDPESKADFLWDVNDGLPFPDNSCAFIYSEHFLEHLPVQQGVRFLAECRRSLSKGGVARIAMPSVEVLVRHYYEKEWAKQPWLEKYGYTWIKTRAEYINVSFRDWGHQWLYDVEELERRLREAGFSGIQEVRWGESSYVDLQKRETRQETLLIRAATK